MRSVIALVLILVSSPVAAEPLQTTSKTEVAITVNQPFRWLDGGSIAVSGYVGLAAHHAMRANVSRYDYTSNLVGDLIAGLHGDDGNESLYQGHLTDVGVAWIYFPRRLWSGFSFEAGLLGRHRNTSVEDDFATPAIVETRSMTIAGRAMLGWNWLIARHMFVSLAFGVSAGYETGKETTAQTLFEPMFTAHDVGRMHVSGEGFLRLGAAFGL